jgi:hypothetical protein
MSALLPRIRVGFAGCLVAEGACVHQHPSKLSVWTDAAILEINCLAASQRRHPASFDVFAMDSVAEIGVAFVAANLRSG